MYIVFLGLFAIITEVQRYMSMLVITVCFPNVSYVDANFTWLVCYQMAVMQMVNDMQFDFHLTMT